MRKVRYVDLESDHLITKLRFEARAERFEMSPTEELAVVAGEAQVKISWKASDNPFIDGYSISRMSGKEEGKEERREDLDGRLTQYAIANTQHEFIDTNVIEEATYTYEFTVHFKSGAELRSDLFTVTVLPVIKATRLLQSYPNPFNPGTWIPYELEKDGNVTIEIYSVNGQRIRSLDLGFQQRGRYIGRAKAAHWDGRTMYGERASSGIYFYVMRASRFSATRKMVIIK